MNLIWIAYDLGIVKKFNSITNNQQYQFLKSNSQQLLMFINKGPLQLTFDQLGNTVRTVNFTMYTSKTVRASDNQVVNKIEKQLTKIPRRLDKINETENEDTFRFRQKQNQKPTLNNSKSPNTNQNIDNMKTKDKSEKFFNTTVKVQRRESCLKDKINTYKEQKLKTIRNLEQKVTAVEDPQTQRNQTIKNSKNDNIDTFALIFEQNQQLAKKIGELQTISLNKGQNIAIWKKKFQEESKVILQATTKQKKENVYRMNLVNYYKAIAFRLKQKLAENKIDTQCSLAQYLSE